jgi:hypothetical protein
MAEFVFKLRQRVIVPNADRVQGIVTCRSDNIDAENSYYVESLKDNARSAAIWTGEAELIRAQRRPASRSKHRKVKR